MSVSKKDAREMLRSRDERFVETRDDMQSHDECYERRDKGREQRRDQRRDDGCDGCDKRDAR